MAVSKSAVQQRLRAAVYHQRGTHLCRDGPADATEAGSYLSFQTVSCSNSSYSLDDGRLADVDRKLALVHEVTPVGLAHLRRIVERAQELIRLAESANPRLPDSKDAIRGARAQAGARGG